MPNPTTIRLDQDTLARLDELAAATDNSRAAIIKEAVARYLEYDAWLRARVRQGLDAARAGQVVSHDEAKKRMRALGIHVD